MIGLEAVMLPAAAGLAAAALRTALVARAMLFVC
jgi:hypothetical protein